MKLIRLINNDRLLVGVNPEHVAAIIEKAGTTSVVFESGHCMEFVESFDYVEAQLADNGAKMNTPDTAALARNAKE